MGWLARIPWSVLIIVSLVLGLAPFQPEPHLVEKLKLLGAGALIRPIDIFDLVMHGGAPALLTLKVIQHLRTR